MSTPHDYDPLQPWQPPSGSDTSSTSASSEESSGTYQPEAYDPAHAYGGYSNLPTYQTTSQVSFPQPSQSPTVDSYWTNPSASNNPSYGSPTYEAPSSTPPAYGSSTSGSLGYGISSTGSSPYGVPSGQAYGNYGASGYNPYNQQTTPTQQSPTTPAQPRSVLYRTISAGVGIFIILLGVFLLFVTPGWAVVKKLDITKAQEGVHHILTDETNGYGIKNIKDIHCNPGKGNPTIKKGETFTCDMIIDGAQRHLTVTFLDNAGTYEVGRPQ